MAHQGKMCCGGLYFIKYLGRVLSYNDNDTPAIRQNLKRARQVWDRISTVITKDSVPPPIAGMF